jgi:hypothetical protein
MADILDQILEKKSTPAKIDIANDTTSLPRNLTPQISLPNIPSPQIYTPEPNKTPYQSIICNQLIQPIQYGQNTEIKKPIVQMA